MDVDKLISCIRPMRTIERALGVIVGVSYGVEEMNKEALRDAVEAIETAVKEILNGT